MSTDTTVDRARGGLRLLGLGRGIHAVRPLRSLQATDEVNSGPGIALSLLACFAPANKGQRATCSTGPIEVPTKRH